MSTDSTSNRVCSKCSIEKPITEFSKDKKGRGGLSSQCRLCRNITNAEWRKNNEERIKRYKVENADKIKKQAQLHRADNREMIRERSRRWRAANPEKVKETGRVYREKNRVKLRESNRAYRIKNIEREREYSKKRKEYRREYHAKNRARYVVHDRNRSARKREAQGTHTIAETRDLFKRQKGTCYYCQKKLINPFTKKGSGEMANLDHVIPLKRGGRNDIGNLVWACEFCNKSKNDKLPHEWRGNNGRLI